MWTFSIYPFWWPGRCTCTVAPQPLRNNLCFQYSFESVLTLDSLLAFAPQGSEHSLAILICKVGKYHDIFENIKISKYQKYQKYHDIFIFSTFSRKWKFLITYITINGTRWWWLLVTSYLYHGLKLSFRRTILTTLRSPYGMSRPSVSVVCDVVAPYPQS